MDGSQQYKLHCCLASFQSDANPFCASLATLAEDPFKFAQELSRVTDGVVQDVSHNASFKTSRKRTHGMKGNICVYTALAHSMHVKMQLLMMVGQSGRRRSVTSV